MNPLSQSIDLIGPDGSTIADFLTGARSGNCLSETEAGYLLSRGYCFPSEGAESLLVNSVLSNDDGEETFSDFLIYPTFQCNFYCIYCYQKDKILTKKVISRQYVDRAFGAIDRIRGSSQVTPLIYLFGGEPLLKGRRHEDIIRYILSESRARKFRTGIISNGSNLKDYSGLLKSYGVEFVQVTLDGPRHFHDKRRIYVNGKGSFDDIVEGIEHIRDDVRIMVRINLDSQNIDSFPEIADVCGDYGWFRDDVTVFVGPYRDLLWDTYLYQMPEYLLLEKVFSFYEKYPLTRNIGLLGWPGVDYLFHFMKTRTLLPPRVRYCIANHGRFGFDPDGNIFACGNAAGREEFAIGTSYPDFILDRDRLDVWRKRRFTRHKKCRACKLAFLCGGGCTLQSLLKYGGNMPYCPGIYENMRVVLDHCLDQVAGDWDVL